MFESDLEKAENDHHEYLQSQMCLTQDCEGNFFVIPVLQLAYWNEYVLDPEYMSWDVPDWAIKVKDPESVRFTRYSLEK